MCEYICIQICEYVYIYATTSLPSSSLCQSPKDQKIGDVGPFFSSLLLLNRFGVGSGTFKVLSDASSYARWRRRLGISTVMRVHRSKTLLEFTVPI